MKKITILFLSIILFIGNANAESIEENINDLMNNVNELNGEIQNLNDINDLYPIGSIYITTTYSNAEAVANAIGGTWEAYAQGRTLIGVGSNNISNYSYGNIGGSGNKTLSTTNMTSHTHTLTPAGTITSKFTGSQVNTNTSGSHNHTINYKKASTEASGYGLNTSATFQNRVVVTAEGKNKISTANSSAHHHSLTPTGTVSSTFTGTSSTTSSVGNGTSFSVQNPYITVYMYKRVG